MTLTLRLRCAPDQRLDMSRLSPSLLAGKSEREVAAIEIHTTRQRVSVGELFEVSGSDATNIVIEGSSPRFDNVGAGLDGGMLTVEGDVGNKAGRGMTGGTLTIRGGAGHWAGSGLSGGRLEIGGDAGDRLGGAFAGESQGMDGGVIIVRGNAGERAGDRQRRGAIVVEGDAGPNAASRMLAGTLIICGRAEGRAGYLMRRGTVVLGSGELAATFADAGVHDLVAMRLLGRHLAAGSRKAATALARPLRRFSGDLAVLGKGEAFVPD